MVKKYDTTTIAISRKVKDEVMEFGNKGESYSEIIERLLESAKMRQEEEILLDDRDCVSIKEALEEAKRRWSKS